MKETTLLVAGGSLVSNMVQANKKQIQSNDQLQLCRNWHQWIRSKTENQSTSWLVSNHVIVLTRPPAEDRLLPVVPEIKIAFSETVR